MGNTHLKVMYSMWSHVYDSVLDNMFAFDRKRVIAALSSKKSVIEVGIGTGLNLKYYPQSTTVTAVDISKSMLAEAREKKSAATVHLQRADVHFLPFDKNAFEAGVATYVFRVLEHKQQALRELSRVIKKNGTLALVDTIKLKNDSSDLIDPFTAMLGWGKNIDLDRLVKNTPWKIVEIQNIKNNNKDALILLKNCKKQ